MHTTTRKTRRTSLLCNAQAHGNCYFRACECNCHYDYLLFDHDEALTPDRALVLAGYEIWIALSRERRGAESASDDTALTNLAASLLNSVIESGVVTLLTEQAREQAAASLVEMVRSGWSRQDFLTAIRS